MISRHRVVQAIYDATWGRWVFAGAYDRFVARSERAGLADQRRRLLAQARGRTLEIATGTGLNLTHYPAAVTELVLTEPYQPMAALLRDKVARTRRNARIVEASGENLPFPDESFDTVVGTMILCTAADPQRLLTEVARVMRPGGQYLFLEHVRNDDPHIARRQDRVQPLWYLFGNGCHCNRDSVAALHHSPLLVEEVDEGRIPEAWSIIERMVTGRARRPDATAAGAERPACADACCGAPDGAATFFT